MTDINRGYVGYSMSKNAADAYDSGEKPRSKWTKAEMLSLLEDINPEILEKAKSLSVKELRNIFLISKGWHHTSKYFNTTDFYAFDFEKAEEMKPEDMPEHTKEAKPAHKRYLGQFRYTVWDGTRNHPKAHDYILNSVWIEERGSTFYVYDENGKELVRKRIGSNGTFVTNYEEEERIKRRKEELRKEQIDSVRKSSGALAANILENFYKKGGIDCSRSGNIYFRNRKPDPRRYEEGLENFFTLGEKRLERLEDGRYIPEEWDGEKFIPLAEDAKA